MTYFTGQVKLISQNKTELSSVPALRSGQMTVMGLVCTGHGANLLSNKYTVRKNKSAFYFDYIFLWNSVFVLKP